MNSPRSSPLASPPAGLPRRRESQLPPGDARPPGGGIGLSEPNTLTVFSLNTCAATSSRKRAAFSLIEVVIAIGIVAIALMGIFSLFSASLKNNRDSSAQQEGFEVARLINSRMQDTNFLSTNDLANLQSIFYQYGRSTNYYAYISNSALVLTNNANNGYGLTNGNLYYVQMAQTTNINSMTNVFPVGSGWSNWPGLPVSVKVYSIPGAAFTNVITNSAPVMTLDTVIPR